MEIELRTLVAEPEGQDPEEKYLALAKTFYKEILSDALDQVANSFEPIDSINLILEHSEPDYAISEYGQIQEEMTEIFIAIPVKLVSPDGDPNDNYEFTVYDLWKKRYKSKFYVNLQLPVEQFDWSFLDNIEWGIWGMWLSWEGISVSENYKHPGSPWFYNNDYSDCFGKTDIYSE